MGKLINKTCGDCKWLKVEFQDKCERCGENLSMWTEEVHKQWTVDEIIEELKDIDAFDAAKYFFDKYN